MKKILLTLFLASIAISQPWPPPSGLSVTEYSPGVLELSWSPAPPLPEIPETLYFDDGDPTGVTMVPNRASVTMRFTPEEPCTVIGMLFKATPPGAIGRVRGKIFSDLLGRPVGVTGAGLVEPRDTIITATLSGWTRIDLTEPYYVTTTFHLGIQRWDSTFNFGAIHDTEPSEDPSRGWLQSGMTIEEIPGDVFLRALIRTPDGVLRVVDGKRTVAYDDPFNTMTEILSPSETMTPTYHIHRHVNPDFAGAYRGETDGTSYRDSTVEYDTPYYYRVRAYYGPGDYSDYDGPVIGITYSGGTGEIFYDTLKTEAGLALGHVSWSAGNRFAVKHTPKVPSMLYKLLFHFESGGSFRPALYEVKRDAPAESLFVWPFTVTGDVGWDEFNTTSRGFIMDRDFIAAANLHDTRLSLSWSTPTIPARSYDYGISSGWNPVADTAYFIRAVMKYETNKWYLNLRRGWNLISMPIIPVQQTPDYLFPTRVGFVNAISPESGDYISIEDDEPLEIGYGYWVMSDRDTSYILEGRPVGNYDVEVGEGWNIIGSVASSTGVPFSSIETFPEPLFVLEHLYWFDPVDRNYDVVNRICPGKGYWINAREHGFIRVSE